MEINNKEKLAPAILSALCKEYFSGIVVNMDRGSYTALNFSPWMEKYPREGNLPDFVTEYVKDYVTGDSQQELKMALSIDSICDYFAGKSENADEDYALSVEYSSWRYGEEHWCKCTVRPLQYKENGDLQLALVLMQDITVHKCSEIRLKKMENAEVMALCIDYTSAYICDLKKNEARSLKIGRATHGSIDQIENTVFPYTELLQRYYERLLIKESAPNYLEKFKAENLIRYLTDHDYIVCRHETVPNPAGNRFFEVKAVKLYADTSSFHVIIGFRPIDEEIETELEYQRLIKTSKQSEFISAISTLYKEIAVIDLEHMTFELVSGPDNQEVRNNRSGTVDRLKEMLLNKNVFKDNREEIEEFTDFSTLSERIRNKISIQKDFRAISGKWYDLTFIVKNLDETGRATHVLMTVRDVDEHKKHELEYRERLKAAKEAAEASQKRAESALRVAELAKKKAEDAQHIAEAEQRRAEEARYAAEEAQKVAQKAQCVAEKAREDADRANDAKTNFLRRMSHDIRTPINGIRGMIQMGDYYDGDLEKQRKYRANVLRATDHLLSMVNDVLDMSKLESGKFILKHEPFRLSDVLDEVNTVTASLAEGSNIRFIPQDIHEIEHDQLLGSPTYLKRVFLNFTSNAVKYNKAGGRVLVYGHEVSFDGKTALYEFVVEDNGIGMSLEFQQHAFEPFTQEEKDDARTKYSGTGLGLAITKQLIDLMGGTLDMRSTEGGGTKITFRIPLDVNFEAQPEKEEKDYSKVRFDGVNVLLAEDNDLNAEIASFVLEQHGMKVTWVQNGQMAVDTVAESPDAYDVIFMDIMMPVMDGLEAAREIRMANAKIPIFAMTANAFMDDIQKSLDAGMNAHLTKPLREKEIVKALMRYVK